MHTTPAAVPTRPLLKPWYRVAESGGGLVFEYAGAAVRLDGAAVRALLPILLPLLDGSRTIDEIVTVAGTAARPAVLAALELLASRGLLAEGRCDDERAKDTSLFVAAGLDGTPEPAVLAARLSSARVAIAGRSRLAGEVTCALRDAGVDAERLSWRGAVGADLVVAAPSSRELPWLGRWNERAIAEDAPWFCLAPYDGVLLAVGPLFLPGETCCYACYRLRRKAVVPYPGEFDAVEERPPVVPIPPALDAVAAGIAAMLVVRWLLVRDHGLPGCLYGLELGGVLALRRHLVHRVPRCPVCSGLDAVAPPLPWYKEVRAAVPG